MPSSYPLDALRQALTADSPQHGVVTRVVGAEAQIATSAGLVTARTSGSISAGQAVSVTAGVCRRRAVVSAEYAL